MGEFDAVIKKYSELGVSLDNIEFAISFVKDGTAREVIIENLVADYRGMEYGLANAMLNDVYQANGGEFKFENRKGYTYGTLFLVIGVACSYYIFHVLHYGGVLVRPVLVTIAAIVCTFSGLLMIIQATRGKYRDDI